MLIIALICVACIYIILYWIWAAASARLEGATSFLKIINDMLFMPDDLVFVLLRGLILATFLYVLGDYLLSSAKRSLKRKEDERNKPPSVTPARPTQQQPSNKQSSNAEHSGLH